MSKRGKYKMRKNWTVADYQSEIREKTCFDSSIETERCDWALGPCWIWQGSYHRNGYGQYKVLDENRAHRVSFKVFHLNGNDLPIELLVCHSCDRRGCCNPEHLFLGTAQDNAVDMVNKGRNTYIQDPTWIENQRRLQSHRMTSVENREKISAGVSRYFETPGAREKHSEIMREHARK